MMGINQFSAVINPPQSAILAIGSTEDVAVFDAEKSYGLKWVKKMSVTLSCDHRVIDGAIGAKWLNVFKNSMENPFSLVI